MDLMQYVPKYYELNEVAVAHFDACEKELIAVNEYFRKILLQTFIKTATTGLWRWEKDFAIPIDPTKTYEERRAVVIMKIISFQTITPAIIKRVVDSMVDQNCTITQNFATYQFIVEYHKTRGIPLNQDDVLSAVLDLRPAHLEVLFDYWYNVWGDLTVMTWNDAAAYTWETIKTAII